MSVVLIALLAFPIVAVGEEIQFANGLKPMDREDIDAHKISLLNSDEIATYSSTATLPSSVDLSNSIYFPPIKNQGSIGSCAVFSAVYYQYTYEVNKLKGTSAQTESNQYSPRWPYYGLINDDDPAAGLKFSEVYNFLEDHGALKWDQDPYDHTAFDYSMPWPTNETYVKEAMLTRLSNWTSIQIEKEGIFITSNTDSDLNEVKTFLNNGKVLTVGVYGNNAYTNEDETIYYRFGTSSTKLGHALTIVGYNDNITYDINGDGIIQNGEKGAFRVANSYGTTSGDKGFLWIMYDALNEVSSVSGDWDDPTTRTGAFENHADDSGFDENDYNLFTYISVEEKDPLLLAEITLNSHDRSSIAISLLNKISPESPYATSYNFQDYIVPQSRTLLFDYGKLIPSFDKIDEETYWAVLIYCSGYDYRDVISSIKLTDYTGNAVKSMSYESKKANEIFYSCNTDFEYGDVNYDGVLTSDDVSKIMQAAANHSSVSSLQMILADYNDDGKVTTSDATALLWAIE